MAAPGRNEVAGPIVSVVLAERRIPCPSRLAGAPLHCMTSLTTARSAARVSARRSLRLLALLALPAMAHAQTRYTITNLGSLGGSTTQANAINAAGAVVGFDATSAQVSRPFLYSGGVMSALPTLNSQGNQATGINAAGVVVGINTIFPNADFRGFIVANGVLTDLGVNTTAVGINDAGSVAGNAFPRAFIRSPAGVVTLFGPATGTSTIATAINASGVVAGYTDGLNRRAFTYANGVVTDLGALPGGTNSYAFGINAAGVVVGQSNESTNRQLHAVIYSGGTVLDIDPTGAGVFGSSATGINSAGVVVGQNSAGRAFVYTAATGIVDLNTVVTNLAASGFDRLISATAINDAGQIVGFGALAGGGTRFGAFRLDVSTIPAAPTITAGPQSHTVAPGASVVFSVAATSTALQYEWRFNGTAIAGATDSTYSIASAAAANAGSYTVVVSNAGGTTPASAPATLTVTPGVAGRLINLSILTQLAGASDSFTMGYVVGGAGTAGAKPLVIRAVGPSLTPLGVGGALADPQLTLFAGPTQNGANDNWGGGTALTDAMTAVGAFAFTGPTSRDAAVAANVAAGDNSVKVSPVGNISGTVIAEIYDASPAATFAAATPRLINVSVLKNIGTSLTAGFVVGGSASKTVLIRAIGPTLASFGVGDTVADPQLALFNSASAKIGENDNWGGTAALTAVFDSVGAFRLSPPTSRDAALVVTLAPGNYSVQVSGVANTTGTALVEVYEVP